MTTPPVSQQASQAERARASRALVIELEAENERLTRINAEDRAARYAEVERLREALRSTTHMIAAARGALQVNDPEAAWNALYVPPEITGLLKEPAPSRTTESEDT